MKLFFLLLSIFVTDAISFYSLTVKNNDTSIIPFEDFKGKPVLIINIATHSPDSLQLNQMEELYQHFDGKLVVLGIPSNDFGNEPLSDAEIKALLQTQYNAHYIIAQKNAGSDSLKHSIVYEWLTNKEQNRIISGRVHGDFYKYLINGAGQITAIFSNEVKPMDKALLDMISIQ